MAMGQKSGTLVNPQNSWDMLGLMDMTDMNNPPMFSQFNPYLCCRLL